MEASQDTITKQQARHAIRCACIGYMAGLSRVEEPTAAENAFTDGFLDGFKLACESHLGPDTTVDNAFNDGRHAGHREVAIALKGYFFPPVEEECPDAPEPTPEPDSEPDDKPQPVYDSGFEELELRGTTPEGVTVYRGVFVSQFDERASFLRLESDGYYVDLPDRPNDLMDDVFLAPMGIPFTHEEFRKLVTFFARTKSGMERWLDEQEGNGDA